jgi:hypothetical protein
LETEIFLHSTEIGRKHGNKWGRTTTLADLKEACDSGGRRICIMNFLGHSHNSQGVISQ